VSIPCPEVKKRRAALLDEVVAILRDAQARQDGRLRQTAAQHQKSNRPHCLTSDKKPWSRRFACHAGIPTGIPLKNAGTDAGVAT